MKKIKSENTKFEQKFFDFLIEKNLQGMEFHSKEICGKPDIVIRKQNIVIFLDSCFWHGCKDHFRMPKHNRAYWESKINRNIEQDRKINQELRDKGWKVIRIWEHFLKTEKDYEDWFRIIVDNFDN